MRRIKIGLAAIAMSMGMTQAASAGDYSGNFMVRVLAAGVISQDSLKSLDSLSGAPVADLRAAGFDASVSDRLIPAATLTYFLNKNLAVELFCCFTKHHITLKPPPAFAAVAGKVADAWMFPPALTLTYHFDGMGAFKPYIGVGAQYIHYFSESTATNTLGAASVRLSDSFGVTLQAGMDVKLGNGWYFNVDVKKSWLDTTATWRGSAVTGGDIKAKADIDPLIISAGVAYRFNLGDLLGRRAPALDPLK